MNSKTLLQARDIERLENTSIATAVGGAVDGPTSQCTSGVCCTGGCITVTLCSFLC
ncbi:MAG: hypothetical protein ACYC2H_02045 [Thermoplasmatota archaeon]